jgi:hypothetical protein
VSVLVDANPTQLRDIRGSGAGVAEISYYGPLAEHLNAEGRRPKAECPRRNPAIGEHL